MDSPVTFHYRDYILFTVIAVGTWLFAQGDSFYRSLNIPYRSPDALNQITIEPGQNARQVGRHLDQVGLVFSPWHFWVAVWIDDSASRLQAGEYESIRALSAREWVSKLTTGQRYRHRITIPEGWNSEQIAARLEKAGLVSASEFLQAVSRPVNLDRYGIESPDLEGYLFPETYFFEKPVSATSVIDVFLREFSSFSDQLGHLNQEQVVLASVIEKEAKRIEDMKIVSAVFHNRLKKGLPLQSDATVLYALKRAGQPDQPLDIHFVSPYNTYRNTGLPPSALCNPGRTALEAAVYPATGEWLYFQTDPDGRFYFARTHREHLRYKKQIRQNSEPSE